MDTITELFLEALERDPISVGTTKAADKNRVDVHIPRLLPYPEEMLPMESYDLVEVNISGGYDSTACILYMLHAYQVPKEKIVLVHCRIDGPPENEVFFDWPETEQYLTYLSSFFSLELVTIWDKYGLYKRIEERGMFPDSKARFCTSFGKREVYTKHARTRKGNILCITGERHEESLKRSTLPAFKVHDATAETKGRLVHVFRPILHLSKAEVRTLVDSAGVRPHRAYQYVSRVSCRFCIFNSRDEMKRVAALFEDDWERLKKLEAGMAGHTMKYQKGQRISLCDFIHENDSFEQLNLSDSTFF